MDNLYRFVSAIKKELCTYVNRNQDEVEQLKRELSAEDRLSDGYAVATEHSGHVIDAVQQTLLDLILKLQEVDEIIEGAAGGRRTSETDEVDFELADLLSGSVDDAKLLRVGLICTLYI